MRKRVYPHEYIDDWETFNKTSLLGKEDFYSHLNKEYLNDADYVHFEIKSLGEYHNLYVKGETLLLTDVFENCRNMCLEIYELDTAKFLSASGLALQVAWY